MPEPRGTRRHGRTPSATAVVAAAVESAKAAGLRYTTDCVEGIRRVRHGSTFRYFTSKGRRVTNREDLARIKALVIPPAWEDVWICSDARGHLQATGRDARGRKQYRYHPKWRAVRDETKYYRMIGFAQALPKIRRRTKADLRRPGLPREKVLALIVQLLEKTLIRVGNDEYAKQNRSFGLTTLRDGHVNVRRGGVTFTFRGKSGVEHEIQLDDPRLAGIVKACRDIPGYDLFQYYDDQGVRRVVGSGDVNAYLKEITGQDYTSKDFRTWAGTVLAAQLLRGFEPCRSQTEAKRNIVRAVEDVSKRLGNTKAVCRKSYIHPDVLDAYFDGSLVKVTEKDPEAAALALLRRRASREVRKKAS
jgi:DNA topoisomerase I